MGARGAGPANETAIGDCLVCRQLTEQRRAGLAGPAGLQDQVRLRGDRWGERGFRCWLGGAYEMVEGEAPEGISRC